MAKRGEVTVVAADAVQGKVLVIRGHQVMLDEDLASLYGVETKALTRAVRRNEDRFPNDFMFPTIQRGVLQSKRAVAVNIEIMCLCRDPPCGRQFQGWPPRRPRRSTHRLRSISAGREVIRHAQRMCS